MPSSTPHRAGAWNWSSSTRSARDVLSLVGLRALRTVPARPVWPRTPSPSSVPGKPPRAVWPGWSGPVWYASGLVSRIPARRSNSGAGIGRTLRKPRCSIPEAGADYELVCRARAEALLWEHRAAYGRIVQALLTHETLDAEAFAACIAGTPVNMSATSLLHMAVLRCVLRHGPITELPEGSPGPQRRPRTTVGHRGFPPFSEAIARGGVRRGGCAPSRTERPPPAGDADLGVDVRDVVLGRLREIERRQATSLYEAPRAIETQHVDFAFAQPGGPGVTAGRPRVAGPSFLAPECTTIATGWSSPPARSHSGTRRLRRRDVLVDAEEVARVVLAP